MPATLAKHTPAVQPSPSTREYCLTCSAPVDVSSHPPPLLHSCCRRRVCNACIAANARLATFCPFCEDACAALRKGPRHDVVRAGKVLWDMDRELDDEDVPVVPRKGQSMPSRDEGPVTAGTNVASAFALGEDEDEEREVKPRHDRSSPAAAPRLPRLLSGSQLGAQGSATTACASTAVTSNTSIRTSDAQSSSSPVRSQGASSHVEQPTNASEMLHLVRRREAEAEQTRGPQSQTRTRTDTEATSKAPPPSTTRSDGAADRKPSASTPSSRLAQETQMYWLRPNDSIMSLSLRFGISARTLCVLNDLPSTAAVLDARSQMLHTRAFVLLPRDAVERALAAGPHRQGTEGGASSSSSTQVRGLEELHASLAGPPRVGKAERVRQLRRQAQARFRAEVVHNAVAARKRAMNATPAAEAKGEQEKERGEDSDDAVAAHEKAGGASEKRRGPSDRAHARQQQSGSGGWLGSLVSSLASSSAGPSGVGSGGGEQDADETPCDARAATAYVACAEEELRATGAWSDDEDDEDEVGLSRDQGAEEGDGYSHDRARRSATATAKSAAGTSKALLREARLAERFESVVRMAVSRWEMDSEWERSMRRRGLAPPVAKLAQPIVGGRGNASSSAGSDARTMATGRGVPRGKGLFGRGAPTTHTAAAEAGRRSSSSSPWLGDKATVKA